MAAERIGRRAYAMEIEPRYVDVALRRWQAFTRKDAVHAETGRTDQPTAERSITPNNPRGRLARQRNQIASEEAPRKRLARVTSSSAPTQTIAAQFGKTGLILRDVTQALRAYPENACVSAPTNSRHRNFTMAHTPLPIAEMRQTP
jgi:hypothetical protein